MPDPTTLSPESREKLAAGAHAPAGMAAQPMLSAAPLAERKVVELPTQPNDEYPPPLGLDAKLLAIFRELDELPLDGTHTQGWSYTSSDAIFRAVREPLRRWGILAIPSASAVADRPYETKQKDYRAVVTASMTITLVDIESGQERTVPWLGAGSEADERALKKGLTGGVATFLRLLFQLPGEDDGPAAAAGRRRNDQGEKLASRQQLNQIQEAANGKLSGAEFLNAILAARGVEPVQVDEAEALKRFPRELAHLTTKEAEQLLATLKEPARA